MVLFWGKGDDGIIVKGLSREWVFVVCGKRKGRGALSLAWVLALWLLGPLPQSITLVLTMVMGEIIGFRCTLDSHLSSKFLPTFYLTLQNMIFFYQLAHSSAVIKQFSDPFWCLFCKLLLTALHIMKICKSKFLINLIKPSLSLLKVDLKEEINIVDKSLDNHFFTILSLQENNNRKYFM